MSERNTPMVNLDTLFKLLRQQVGAHFSTAAEHMYLYLIRDG